MVVILPAQIEKDIRLSTSTVLGRSSRLDPRKDQVSPPACRGHAGGSKLVLWGFDRAWGYSYMYMYFGSTRYMYVRCGPAANRSKLRALLHYLVANCFIVIHVRVVILGPAE